MNSLMDKKRPFNEKGRHARNIRSGKKHRCPERGAAWNAAPQTRDLLDCE
jgi:hypothetical protein